MPLAGSKLLADHASSSSSTTARRWRVPLLFFLAVTIPWIFFYHAASPDALFASLFLQSTKPGPPLADVPTVPVDTKPDPVDTKPAPVDTKPDPVYTKPDPVDTKPAPVDTKTTPVDTKPAPVDTKSAKKISSPPPIRHEHESDETSMERIFSGAAMADNTVILTLVNEAWAEPGSMLDLFLEGLRIGQGTEQLRKHLVMVAVDDKAYQRCTEIHPHCFALRTEGVDFSGYKQFMTKDYLLMMWRRLDFLRIVLQKGFSFLISDLDIMWFRNPFLGFTPDADFQIACDKYVGNPTGMENSPNNGFVFVRANNRTVKFYKYWYASRKRFPGQHEQMVLDTIKREKYVQQGLGVKMRFLSTEYYGGICQPPEDFDKVITFHVNCCIGMDRKNYDLRLMLDDWRSYMNSTLLQPSSSSSSSSSSSLKRTNHSQTHYWSIPDHCRFGWKPGMKKPERKPRHRL